MDISAYIILVAAAVVILCILMPNFGLVAALFMMYNPIYSFYVINLQGFEQARVRIMASIASIAMLFISVFLRKCIKDGFVRVRTPLDIPLIILIPFFLFSTFIGVARENSAREITAAIFPLVEGTLFFFLTGHIIKDAAQVKRTLAWVLVWIIINFSAAIILYINYGSQYYFRLDIGGVYIPRLTDFMVVVIWPMLFVYYLYSEDFLQKKILMLSLLIGLVIIILGSFRSIWLGVIVAAVFTSVIARNIRISPRKVVEFLVLALFFLIGAAFLLKSTILQEAELTSLISGRISSEGLQEGTSYGGRLDAYRSLFMESLDLPFFLTGHGFGSEFTQIRETGVATMPVSSSPNYYLNLAYEMGYISVFILGTVAAFAMSLLKKIHARAASIETRKISIAVLAGVISNGIVISMFPSLLHFPIMPFLGIGFALAFASDSFERAENERLTC